VITESWYRLVLALGIPFEVHLVANAVEAEAIVTQPVFERRKVLEERFPRQGLVPTLTTGDE